MEQTKLYYLVQALRLVALPCEEQIKALPDYVAVADEIAITFDDTLLTFDGSDESAGLEAETFERMRELDRYFDQLDKDEFTIGALCRSPKWQGARQMAGEILSMLGTERGLPDLGWITFVKGSPTDSESRDKD